MHDIGAMYTEIHELELMAVLTDIYAEVDALDKTIAESAAEPTAESEAVDPESLERADKIQNQPPFENLEIDLAGFVLLFGYVLSVLMLRN